MHPFFAVTLYKGQLFPAVKGKFALSLWRELDDGIFRRTQLFVDV
jgi:hypothetical protein